MTTRGKCAHSLSSQSLVQFLGQEGIFTFGPAGRRQYDMMIWTVWNEFDEHEVVPIKKGRFLGTLLYRTGPPSCLTEPVSNVRMICYAALETPTDEDSEYQENQWVVLLVDDDDRWYTLTPSLPLEPSGTSCLDIVAGRQSAIILMRSLSRPAKVSPEHVLRTLYAAGCGTYLPEATRTCSRLWV